MPKFEHEDGKPQLVGDWTIIGNNQSIPVYGFGVVVNLPGTGGEDANTPHYRWVLDDLNRQKFIGGRAFLARPDNAVVEIRGQMHPGIQERDRFDVQVVLPMDSNTRSLRGGVLMTTRLAEMGDFGGDLQAGTTRAYVAGPIIVDDPMATEANNPDGLKSGTILSGAVTAKSQSRSLSLIMREKSIAGATQIADAINHRFHQPTGNRRGVASAETDVLIFLDIHPTYANDIPRYIRVIQSIACHETPEKQLQRIERLREELLHPDTAQHAAFQLEAIGRRGIEPLQQALRSPNVEVRFHAATSLAYLGSGTPARELADIARKEPAFRVYVLNALSVMQNDLEAEYHLQELLHVPCAETRYGAFRALKTRNPWDQTIRGEVLGGVLGFSYHGITSPAPPMVHLTMRKLPEVVLFGADIFLKQPFALDAGPIIYVNGQSLNHVVISRFANTTGIDERRTVLSNRLDDIIRAVVDIGGTYPDVVQMLRQADMMGVLSCRLEIDCLPEPNRTYYRQSSNDALADTTEEKPASIWERLNPRNIFSPNPGEKSSDYMGTVNTSSRD
jgi:hypothetical protein